MIEKKTINNADYTSKEIVWMETLEYEIRRYAQELRFYTKRKGPLKPMGILFSITGLVMFVIMMINSTNSESIIPIPKELIFPIMLIFGIPGLIFLLLAKLFVKSPNFLTIDLKKKEITDHKRLLVSFDSSHVEIRPDSHLLGAAVASSQSNKSYESYLYKLICEQGKIFLYHTFVENHHKELKQTLDEAGLKTEMISPFDLG